MTWNEAVKQHVGMWKAKEASVPRGMISVCTYDDFPGPSKLKALEPKSAGFNHTENDR